MLNGSNCIAFGTGVGFIFHTCGKNLACYANTYIAQCFCIPNYYSKVCTGKIDADLEKANAHCRFRKFLNHYIKHCSDILLLRILITGNTKYLFSQCWSMPQLAIIMVPYYDKCIGNDSKVCT